MATSFKVPASPKKSIFEIDNFLGVDLTNNGTNIEEHRSPNAENMVRYVPGKVRKRTGYQTETVFGNGLNTNLAIGSDGKEKTIEVTPSMQLLYDLFIKKGVGEEAKLYFDFEYMCSDKIWITGLGWVDASPDEYTHIQTVVDKDVEYGILDLQIAGKDTYSVHIKKFSFMYDQDENYRWTKAPKYFVYRPTNDPVYGCHRLKHGTFDGNRVVNVNRALNTSSSWKSYSLTTASTTLCVLAERQFRKRTLYVEFDYTLLGDAIDFNYGGQTFRYEPTSTEVHVSEVVELTSTVYVGDISIVSSGVSTFEIKNLSVMYEKDDSYSWSQAPEDEGLTFHLEDTYLKESTDYAIIKEYTDSTNATDHVLVRSIEIANSISHADGMALLKFDLHTSSFNDLNSLIVKIYTSTNVKVWEKTYTSHLNSERYELFISPINPTGYISRVELVYNVTGNGACYTKMSGISLNATTPRTNFNVSSIYKVYHVGTDLFLHSNYGDDFTKVYSAANKAISTSWQLNDSLYILDGNDIYSYTVGDETVKSISKEKGYIPTVTIAKKPKGGGVPYDDLNLLQPKFYELFSGDTNGVAYYLSFNNLDSEPVKAWVMDANGNWIEKVEKEDFTVNRATGCIDFFRAPGVSPLTGEDNVKILAARTVPGYRERITHCTIGTLFGVNGASDRLFLSGNPDYPNYDWYSERYDPTYFPDTGYSSLGLSSSAIVGYAIVNNYLATFKDEFEPSQSVFIREGDSVTDEQTKILRPVFKLINTLQGNGVIAPHSFGYIQTEPLFLTRSGIFAITPQDISGEKYAQNRSFYLDGALINEPGLENAYATIFNDMYVLALNNKLYILDGLQATRTDRSEPYATRQYVGFVCTGIPARCLWEDSQSLYFGSYDGHVCSFATDINDLESYNDDGKPIYCCWETPDLDGQLFYKNKSFRYIAIRMMSALKTSAKLWAMARGAWSFIKEDNTTGIFFDFENIDFEAFSFSTDRSDKVAHSKIRVKKVDKARFKIENDKLNEPFGLLNLALEYVESGNYKG